MGGHTNKYTRERPRGRLIRGSQGWIAKVGGVRGGAQGGKTGGSESGVPNSMTHKRGVPTVKAILEVDSERLTRSEFLILSLRS